MLGAILGDLVGSRFEFNNIKTKDFEFMTKESFLTDDSYMTLAIAEAILSVNGDWSKLGKATVQSMQKIGRKHPNCGFGNNFHTWIFSDHPKPYHSYGNGAAMRVSPCGWIAKSEEEAIQLSKVVTEVSHDHPEGLKGAEAVTIAIFLAKNKATKKEIQERIEKDYYPLDFTLDEIREDYSFNETCQETVPQAIMAFLESHSFEDTIRNAISIGGDSDTLAAIAGSIAEAYYPIPLELQEIPYLYLDEEVKEIYSRWDRKIKSLPPKDKE